MAEEGPSGELFDEDRQYWIAGYELENDYYNLQEESRAVDYDRGDVSVDWDRWEAFNDAHRDAIGDELQESNYVVMGWIDDDGYVHYATLVDGIDIDYFDFDAWLEDHDEDKYGTTT